MTKERPTVKNRRGRSPGQASRGKTKTAGATALENRDPIRAGEVMAYIAQNPDASLKAVCQAHGLSEGVVQGIMKRLNGKYVGVKEAMRATTNPDLIAALDDKLVRTLEYVDDYTLAQANLRELAYGIDRFLNARQLLKGQPTQIISIDERKSMLELLPYLRQEAERRGRLIEGYCEEVTE